MIGLRTEDGDVVSTSEVTFSRAGGLRGEAITHPKREECGCPLLKLGPKRRPSQKREVRVERGSACTSEEEGI